MSSPKDRRAVQGSEREPLPGARIAGPADPNERIEVTVRIRRRGNSNQNLASQIEKRQHMSREDFAATYGADPADIATVEDFAHEHNLTVIEASAARRSVILSGTVADMSNAFGVYLANYTHPGGSYRGRTGSIHVPTEIHDIIEGVFGLDNRPQAKPHFRHYKPLDGLAAQPHASPASFTPPQLAKLYDFPAGDGTGQCIAIIELGGGYRTTDLTAYFKQLGVSSPKVISVSVDNGHNSPAGNPNSADGEVLLDIEVAGAIAPKSTIVVYFAPNTDKGFLDAITKAIHDTQHKPSVISISWGGPESAWSSQATTSYDNAFQSAAALGITICCAAGDDGSSDGVNDGHSHVDFPASSPHVLACGGTRLAGSGTTITSEVVWNDGPGQGSTGGGISEVFALPSYQASASVPPSVNPGAHKGRGVPDVAGDADPATGYQVRVDGQKLVFGGTSAVAPLWAALVALINQKLQRHIGFINPLLYNRTAGSPAFHDITSGTNGAFAAHAGWDPCTGLGTPNGAAVLGLFSTTTSSAPTKATASKAGKQTS